MIEVGVRMDNLANAQAFLCQYFQDFIGVPAGISYNGLSGNFIADNGAVALQRPYGKSLDEYGILSVSGHASVFPVQVSDGIGAGAAASTRSGIR